MNTLLSPTKKNYDLGLLIIRVGIGVMFMVHGSPKIFGGPEFWAMIGGSMANLGIDFAPTFWGFAAAFAEFFGGLCLILGIFTGPACLLLICTMIVATINHLANGDGIGGASHAIEAGILFLGLLFVGPGRYSLDAKIFG